MNKFIKLTITFLMVFAVAGCGSSEESIKLETQTVNGLKRMMMEIRNPKIKIIRHQLLFLM